jgi:hypothetical protein
LKVYTQYINNYNQAASRLEECKKNKLFAQFLLDCKSLPKVELELSSYLIMPIQRIPRYQLLLDGLVKATPKDHPDYTDLSSALKQIVSVADYMNERKRDVENILHMTNLQGQMLYKDDKFVVSSCTPNLEISTWSKFSFPSLLSALRVVIEETEILKFI